MAASKEVVAFLGPKASYTHQATLDRFAVSQHDLIPQTTIEDVFAAVQSGTAHYGVVPFENSSNGSVVITLDLFADLTNRYPDILVCGEIYLPVHHCLLGHVAGGNRQQHHPPQPTDLPWRSGKDGIESAQLSGHATPTQPIPQPGWPRVAPICDITRVKKLYSHPQAWGQCRLFLATYLKGIERLDVSSTSKAAEIVSQDVSGSSAAISSRIAADLTGLDVLAEGIEDREGNSTRFFILQRQRDQRTLLHGVLGEGDEREKYKTLVSFTVEHGEPGALADCLAVFKQHHLNLTSINARPSGEAAWHYIFFVEFMGKKRSGSQGGAVNRALQDLGQVAKSYRWLGSWENMLQ